MSVVSAGVIPPAGSSTSRMPCRDEAEMGTRPLEKALRAGAVDNVGGDRLGLMS